MTLEEQLKDLQEKLDMTQAIKHGGIEIPTFVLSVSRKGEGCPNIGLVLGWLMFYLM